VLAGHGLEAIRDFIDRPSLPADQRIEKLRPVSGGVTTKGARSASRPCRAFADRAELNLVGLATRAERKVIDKIVDGLKFHS
jgi:hypothetical protein